MAIERTLSIIKPDAVAFYGFWPCNDSGSRR